MNQDSSFPPMLPPSGEFSALLFAILPCLQETYRPLASFAYHMTELTKLKTLPSVPSLTGLSGIDALITDKDIMLRSLSFYGKMFRMPLLSTIASLLQGMQFYQAYKEILPGLLSAMGASGTSTSPDLFSMLGGLSPDILSGLFSGFTGESTPNNTSSAHASDTVDRATEETQDINSTTQEPDNTAFSETSDPLYDSLYSFLTPEQQEIYEHLMHTD